MSSPTHEQEKITPYNEKHPQYDASSTDPEILPGEMKELDDHEVFRKGADVDFRTVSWQRASVIFLKIIFATGVLSIPTAMVSLGAVGGALNVVGWGALNTYTAVIQGNFRNRHLGCHSIADMAHEVGGVWLREIVGLLFVAAYVLCTGSGIIGVSVGKLNTNLDHRRLWAMLTRGYRTKRSLPPRRLHSLVGFPRDPRRRRRRLGPEVPTDELVDLGRLRQHLCGGFYRSGSRHYLGQTRRCSPDRRFRSRIFCPPIRSDFCSRCCCIHNYLRLLSRNQRLPARNQRDAKPDRVPQSAVPMYEHRDGCVSVAFARDVSLGRPVGCFSFPRFRRPNGQDGGLWSRLDRLDCQCLLILTCGCQVPFCEDSEE